MTSEVFSAAVLLLLLIDPFGHVPPVVSALSRVPEARRARVIVRECVFAYLILLAFMAGGRTFLALLHLSDTALTIAGGVILFLIALRMVFPRPEGVFGDPHGGEPLLVPLAVPMIAGPSALATVMLLASREPGHLVPSVIALTAAMAVATAVLLGAHRLQAALGERVVIALERLMGLVLTALAVQMLLDGVRAYVAQLAR